MGEPTGAGLGEKALHKEGSRGEEVEVQLARTKSPLGEREGERPGSLPPFSPVSFSSSSALCCYEHDHRRRPSFLAAYASERGGPLSARQVDDVM